jgi:hypothetical protein
MYNATLERSTPIDRIMRTTTKAISDAQMKEDAALRRAYKATGLSIRDKLIAQGALK